ncbi:tetratricopeptide repeat protein [Kiloniella laminariae]|uniref:Tetratricopeptide repeat protein n=1 Tax=Kiloniella laminariae TaxID=454162 RepID=A0ABT4LMG0_9PROT|nr:tetratricopeptide repeat protein [Kiloniella laminariae]MCZ4282246.1 tetratricopeptide repeat protein [Kiloniella laminariae]
MRFRHTALGLLFAAGLSAYSLPVSAAGSGWDNQSSPELKEAVKLIKGEKYTEALPLLTKVTAEDPKNADAFNMLGYSLRKLGNKDDALSNYTKALEINPRHRGANAYLGELYLEMNQPNKALERLEILDESCFFGCDEYSELKTAIEKYKSNQ